MFYNGKTDFGFIAKRGDGGRDRQTDRLTDRQADTERSINLNSSFLS